MLVIAIVIKSREPTQKGWISATYWNPLVIPPGLPQLNPRNPLQLIIFSAVVFVGKSHRELIKMLRLLERSEKLKENKNVVQDCGCMQDNLLVTKTDIPIKLPA